MGEASRLSEEKRTMKNIKVQERAIKDIIKKYGPVIDLKKAPYLIAEIVRNYSHVFGSKTGPVADAPEPGTPPVPGGVELNPQEIFQELAKLSTNLKKLNEKIDKLMAR